MLRKGTAEEQSLSSRLRPSPSGNALPEQGVLSQGRGELKYLAYQRRTIYKGSGHTGLRGKRGAWKVTVEGHCEPGSARRSQQVKAPAEGTRAVFLPAFRRVRGEAPLRSHPPAPPSPTRVNLQSSRPGISPAGFSLGLAGSGPLGPRDPLPSASSQQMPADPGPAPRQLRVSWVPRRGRAGASSP